MPALGIAQADDAGTRRDIARATIALAAPTALAQLQRIAIVSVVAYLTMIARITLRALRANVFGVLLDQAGLRTQIHVVVALQLAAGREVVGLLRQGAGATLAIVWRALQRIAVETELATLAAAAREIKEKKRERIVYEVCVRIKYSLCLDCGEFSVYANQSNENLLRLR